MLKKSILTVISIIVLFLLIGVVMTQIISMGRSDSDLKVNLQTISGTNYSKENFPLVIVFENASESTIRILDAFSNTKALPVFFNFEIKDSNGTPIPVPGAGKISIAKNSENYIELEKGERHEITVNLKDIIPSTTQLKSDVYSISVTYRNQYGNNCFKGQVKSNTIQVALNE